VEGLKLKLRTTRVKKTNAIINRNTKTLVPGVFTLFEDNTVLTRVNLIEHEINQRIDM